LSGGTLAAGASCNFSVNVTATATGTINDTTGAITSTEGGTGATSNTASLLVTTPGNISITSNPGNLTILDGSTATFTASATGTPTPTVQWQVSTDGGSTWNNVSGATTTTLSFTSTPLENDDEYQAVFTNTSGSLTTSAAQLTLTEAASCASAPSGKESVLTGHWVVRLQGWNGLSPAYPIASVFDFDANGSGGFVDVTGGSGVTGNIDMNNGANGASSVFSGNVLTAGSSYQVGLDPTNGTGYLGCMTLANSGGGSATVLRFALSVTSAVATKGHIIQWTDTSGTGSGIRATGIMLPQDSAAFTYSALKSTYAFQAEGQQPSGAHVAVAGVLGFTSGNPPTVTSSLFDLDNGGTVFSSQSYTSPTISNLNTETGRYEFTATTDLASVITTSHTAVYVVNSNEAFTVGIDPYSTFAIVSGRSIVTGSSFTNASLSGNYVLRGYGNSSGNSSCNGGGTCATVALGELNFSGTGTLNNTSQVYNYTGDGSGIQTGNASGTYTVAASGRVALTGGSHNPVFYLTAPVNSGIDATEPIAGFVVGTDSPATSGQMDVGASSNVSVSSLANNYSFGNSDPGDPGVKAQDGVANVDTSGNVSGYSYQSNSNTGLTECSINCGGNGSPAFTISNSPLPGFGSLGSGTYAITDGTRIWFIDTGDSGKSPASIAEIQP
jgi:hypothetical protein